MGGSSANRLTGLTDGVDGSVLGDAGGEQSHTLTEGQLPAHRHTMFNNAVSNTTSLTAGAYAAYARDTSNDNDYYISTSASVANVYGTLAAGSDDAHNNVQPTIILNYIIKS